MGESDREDSLLEVIRPQTRQERPTVLAAARGQFVNNPGAGPGNPLELKLCRSQTDLAAGKASCQSQNSRLAVQMIGHGCRTKCQDKDNLTSGTVLVKAINVTMGDIDN